MYEKATKIIECIFRRHVPCNDCYTNEGVFSPDEGVFVEIVFPMEIMSSEEIVSSVEEIISSVPGIVSSVEIVPGCMLLMMAHKKKGGIFLQDLIFSAL